MRINTDQLEVLCIFPTQSSTPSTYYRNFFNGFSINGVDSRVERREIRNLEYHKLINKTSKYDSEYNWGFIYGDKKEYEVSVH